MAAMRPGAPQFSVGDFIWQEIKNVSENPQKICSYSPYIMFVIWKVRGTKFPNDVKHKPLRPPVNRTPRLPSPEGPGQEENEIRGEDQHQQHFPAAQTGAGLTGSQDRSDRSPLR